MVLAKQMCDETVGLKTKTDVTADARRKKSGARDKPVANYGRKKTTRRERECEHGQDERGKSERDHEEDFALSLSACVCQALSLSSVSLPLSH